MFETIEVLKESDRGTVKLIRHRATGKRFILRSFQGNGEVYRELLSYRSSRLPMIYEVASEEDRNLVLEEYIEGDNMGTLLKESLFTPKETRKIVRDLCLALWILHSMGAVHRDVKPENVMLRGGEAVLIDFDAARFYKEESDSDTRILGTAGFAAPPAPFQKNSMGGSDPASGRFDRSRDLCLYPPEGI